MKNGVLGKWKVIAEIRKLFVKGLPPLKPGNVIVILAESLEEDSKSSKDKDESEFLDSSGFSLNMKKAELTITQAILDAETIEFECPETRLSSGKKVIVEFQIYSDSSLSQLLGIHHQLLCLLEKKQSSAPISIPQDMLEQLLSQS